MSNINNMSNMNNFDFGQRYFNQSPFNSNITFVTSLDEALYKTNYRNSDMIYFHQDQNVFYRIKVDNEGHKTWAQFEYSIPKTSEPENIDLKSLVSRIERLENTVLKPVNGEVIANNAELNG